MTGTSLYMRAAWCLFGAWLGSRACATEHFSTAWSTYVGGDWEDDHVCAVAVDSDGNAYLGGALLDGAIQNNAGAPEQLNQPGFVAKTSPGGTLLWATDFGLAEPDDVMAVLGLAAGPSRIFAVGCNTPPFGDASAFIAALVPADGSCAWLDQSIGAPDGTNSFNAVTVAADGSVYAAGHTSIPDLVCDVSTYPIGGTVYGTNLIGDIDALVVKYAPDGAVLWRRYLGGMRADSALAVAVTPDGSVYVAGETRSANWVSLAASGTASATNAAGFLAKLTPDGAHVWSAYLDGSHDDAVTALRADPATASLFLGGSTASPDFLAAANRLNSHAGGTDGFVARITDTQTAFHVDWCRFAGGAASDRLSALGILADGRLAAGGTTSSGGWFALDPGSEAFHGTRDGFVTLLDTANGAVSWTTCLGGAAEDQLHALAVDSNTLFTAGHTFSTNWVGGGFWTDWNKDDWGYPIAFGFAVKWQPGAPIIPAFTVHPADCTAQEGATVSFTAAAAGTAPLFYRWLRNDAPLPGATASNLTFAAAHADDGALYSCIVSNIAGTATSQAATLTVIPMGTLTVTLSPSDAVTRGARWCLDSGPDWLASGLSTNLPAGAYAITFTNLIGWTAPEPLAAVQVPHAATAAITAAYTPILPEAERAISGTNVSVTVRAPAGLAAWTLAETLPDGLTPAAITAGGIWNAGTRTLTFTGLEATTNTYGYRVICASSGVYTVSGAVTPAFASTAVPVTGDNEIINAKLIRAIDGTSVTITILESGVWPVTENIPAGLTPGNIIGGMFNAFNNGQIFWYISNGPDVLSYTVTGEAGAYTLSGMSGTEPILGDTVLTIPGEEIPPPDILTFAPSASADTFTLTFTSVVNRAYLILTNASLGDPAGWGACIGPIPGAAGATQCEVPAVGPRLFYRVRTE